MADPKIATHPYFPLGIALSGDVFVSNDWDVTTLVLVFMAGWAMILGATLLVVGKANPNLKLTDRGLVLWFVLCESPQPRDHLTRALLTSYRRCYSSVLRGVFRGQPHQHGCQKGLFWAAVEGICPLGFQIPLFRPICSLYGDHHGGTFTIPLCFCTTDNSRHPGVHCRS